MSKKIQQAKKLPEQPLYKIEVKFDRSNATYKPEEFVSGSISFIKRQSTKFSIGVQSIKMTVNGKVKIQNRNNNKIIQELLDLAQKIQMIHESSEICQNNTISQDTSLPFKFKLSKDGGQDKYLESYIGVYVCVFYDIVFDVKFTNTERIQSQHPFYVQVQNAGRQLIPNFQYPKPKHFVIRSEDIKSQMIKGHKFKVRGELQSEIIYFSDYLLGKIIIDLCQSPIRSIDLQMLRNQKISSSGKTFNEVTQIQLIQLCDGDVTRNMQLPIYMILPRYYSCPSIQYKWLTVTFEINLLIGFKDGYKITANIPLKLIRS